MASNEVVIHVKSNTTQAEKGISKLNQKVGAMSAGMMSAGRSLALIALPLVGIGISSLRTAADFEEMSSKFNVVFGDMAGEVETWAEDTGKSVGRAKSHLMDYASGIQDMLVPMGFSRPAAAEMSKAISELAIDVASFTNKSDGDVIRDFSSALVGSHEPLYKYGILITEDTLRQSALNLGIDATDRKLTQEEKVLARVAIMFSNTADAQGDAERTSESYTNQVKAAEAAMIELNIAIGNALIPTMTSLVKIVSPIISKMATWAEENPTLVKTVIAVGTGIGILGVALIGLGLILPGITAVMGIFSAVSLPLVLIIGGITAAIVAGFLIWKNWGTIVSFFGNLWNTVWTGIKSVFNTVTSALSTIFRGNVGWILPGGILVKALFAIKDNWATIWGGIKSIASTIWGALKTVFNSKFFWILPGGALLKGLGWIRDNWGMIWNGIKTVASTVWGAIKTAFESKFGWLLPGGLLFTAINAMKENWDTIWIGMKDVLLGNFSDIVRLVRGPINSVLGFINSLIDAWNSLKFESAEKKILGVTVMPAFSMGMPQLPNIPLLAKENFGGIESEHSQNIPHFARGTSNFAGGAAIVGEQGPELVDLPRGSRVTPMRGGGSIHIHFEGPVYGFDDFEEKVSRATRDIAQRGGFDGVLVSG